MKEQLYAFYGEGDSKYQAKLSNIWRLGQRNFALEWRELLRELRRLAGRDIPEEFALPSCLGFELSNAAIAERERTREALEGAPDAWPVVRLVYRTVCIFLDILYGGPPHRTVLGARDSGAPPVPGILQLSTFAQHTRMVP